MTEMKTYYVVQPFYTNGRGVRAGEAYQVSSAEVAKRAVERLAVEGKGGIAFSRRFNAQFSEYEDAQLIHTAGIIVEHVLEELKAA